LLGKAGLVPNGLYGIDFRLNAGSVNVRTAKNTVSPLGGGTFNTPVGPLNGVIDTGEILDTQVVTSVTSPFTPDPTKYTRYNLTSTILNQALIINPPNIAWSGMQMRFTIRNGNTGTLTVTWPNGAGQYRVAWTNPTNGNSASVTFAYDGTNWIQISGVSAIPN
jgi:hypothetical protein